MSANDAKPTGGENKEVAKKRINSPNIKSAADEVVAEPQLSEEEARRKAKETVAIDGIPIDEKDIKFRAKDIKEADTGKLFVKVEGAEERKKALIRDMEKQKAELIHKEEELKRQTARTERKAKSSVRRQTRRKKIADTFWVGKKKIVTILVAVFVLVLAIGGPLLWRDVIAPAIEVKKEQKSHDERQQDYESSQEAKDEADRILDGGGRDEASYSEAKGSIEEKMDNANSDEKLYLSIQYGRLVYEVEGNSSLAADSMLKYEEEFLSNCSEAALVDYYSAISSFYEKDTDEFNYYEAKSIEHNANRDVIIHIDDGGATPNEERSDE